MKIYQMTNDELVSGIKALGEFFIKEGLYPPEQSAFGLLVDEFLRRSKECEEITSPDQPKCGCGSTDFELEGERMACTFCGVIYGI